jgi:hypothetical protein
MPFKIIIGRPDIIKYDILDKLMTESSDAFSDSPQALGWGAHASPNLISIETEQVALLHDIHKGRPMANNPASSVITDDEDDEVIQKNHWDDTWTKSAPSSSSTDPLDVVEVIIRNIVSKDEGFKTRLRMFLAEWRDLFSSSLRHEPADLDPLVIEVDKSKWDVRQNTGPPRMLSLQKESHLRKFIDEGLAHGIIRRSTATHYSQVFLVPKPPVSDGTRKYTGLRLTSGS